MRQIIQSPTDRQSPITGSWIREVERLYIQLHLHSEDSLKFFDIQKSMLFQWLERMEERINTLDIPHSEVADTLIEKMRQLRFELSVGNSNSAQSLLEQQNNIHKGIAELQQYMYVVRNVAPPSMKELAEMIDSELIRYRTKFSLFRLRLKLSSNGMKDMWRRKKKELSRELRMLHYMLEKGKVEAVESLKRLHLELNI